MQSLFDDEAPSGDLTAARDSVGNLPHVGIFPHYMMPIVLTAEGGRELALAG